VTAPTKLAGFAAILAVLFGGGAAAGALVEADPPGGAPRAGSASRPNGGGEMGTAGHGGAMPATGGGEAGGHGGGHGAAAKPVRGLAVSENGLRLVVARPELRRGVTQTLRFRVLGADGRAVRRFDVEHTKRMHLIVARRDLTGFQHLHPRMLADGTWTTTVRLPAAGSYRMFADFAHAGVATTLASDLRVDGTANLQALPAPVASSRSDGGYDVRLDAGTARAGRNAELRFTVTKDGQPVHVEPYLGADGHLVALRDGDLAFLHVHPAEHAAAGNGHDDSIGFEATFPTTGRYGLFLQFRHAGRVQTVAFTQEVK
jgi:hypothetical protein